VDSYIEYRCPNIYTHNGKKYECRAELGGPSIKTLLSHDYSTPFKDLRYCPKCHVFWEITTKNSEGLPEYVLLPRDTKIKFLKPWLSSAEGRINRHGKA